LIPVFSCHWQSMVVWVEQVMISFISIKCRHAKVYRLRKALLDS